MKTCTKCGEETPLDGFRRDVTTRDGLYGRCRLCESAYKRQRYQQPAVKAAKLLSDHMRRAADSEGYRAYTAAHDRIKRANGSASQYLCAVPGCERTPYGWALECGHPSVRRSERYIWSDNIDAYRPMCHFHNAQEDAERRRREAEVTA